MTPTPLSEIRERDIVLTPRGLGVHVETVEARDDGRLVLRWWRPQARYHDGYRIESRRLLGSFVPMPPDALVDLLHRLG